MEVFISKCINIFGIISKDSFKVFGIIVIKVLLMLIKY